MRSLFWWCTVVRQFLLPIKLLYGRKCLIGILCEYILVFSCLCTKCHVDVIRAHVVAYACTGPWLGIRCGHEHFAYNLGFFKFQPLSEDVKQFYQNQFENGRIMPLCPLAYILLFCWSSINILIVTLGQSTTVNDRYSGKIGQGFLFH